MYFKFCSVKGGVAMNKRLHDSGFGDMAGFFAAITADLGGSLAQLSVLVDDFYRCFFR